MYLNGNGRNVLQPNPNLPYSNYHILSADSIYEFLNTNAIERYLGRELTKQAVELIFSRDAIVRKAISSWGAWMSLAPWEVQADDPDVASYIRDSIDSTQLLGWLGEAYTYASIYEDAFLVLSPDFETVPEIIGIAHAGNAWKTANGYFNFINRENNELSFYQDQLIQVDSTDSLSRFYFEYEKYVTAIEQISALIPVSELLICNQEKLAEDLKRMETDQQEIFLEQRIMGIKSGAYNKGVILGDATLKVQLLHRKLEEIMRGLEALESNMISASNLPESFLRGSSKAGTGLASVDEREKAQISQGVDSRRKLHWTRLVNWVIGILLERIGENPRAASIKWVSSYQIDPEKLAKVEKTVAEMDEIYMESGVLEPQEVRTSRFSGKIKSKEVFIPPENTKEEFSLPEEIERVAVEKPKSTTAPSEVGEEFSPTESSYSSVEEAIMSGGGVIDSLGYIYHEDNGEEDVRDLWRKYKSAVNMTYSELLRWSKDRRSNLASIDRSPINRNIILLSANFERFQKSRQLQKNAQRTISFVARMRNMPNGRIIKNAGLSKRDISLLNWAYDPFKARGSKIPSDPSTTKKDTGLILTSNRKILEKRGHQMTPEEMSFLRKKLKDFKDSFPQNAEKISISDLLETYSYASMRGLNAEQAVEELLSRF